MPSNRHLITTYKYGQNITWKGSHSASNYIIKKIWSFNVHRGRPAINKYTFLMGSEDINVMTAIRSCGKTNCPSGLFISEQTWEIEYRRKDRHATQLEDLDHVQSIAFNTMETYYAFVSTSRPHNVAMKITSTPRQIALKYEPQNLIQRSNFGPIQKYFLNSHFFLAFPNLVARLSFS